MRISVLPTADAVADAAAAVVSGVVTAGRPPVIGLPTGRTPIGLYARLRTAPLDWSAVRTFNLDEFDGVSPGHAGSFRRYMDTHLFSAVAVPPAQIGFLRGDTADAAAECVRYDHAIAAAGGLDLLVCGLGANGHIGFNEPGPVLWGPTHVATLARGDPGGQRGALRRRCRGGAGSGAHDRDDGDPAGAARAGDRHRRHEGDSRGGDDRRAADDGAAGVVAPGPRGRRGAARPGGGVSAGAARGAGLAGAPSDLPGAAGQQVAQPRLDVLADGVAQPVV